MHFLKDAWKNLDDPEWVQEMLKLLVIFIGEFLE